VHSEKSGNRSECIRGQIGKSNTEDGRFNQECANENKPLLDSYYYKIGRIFPKNEIDNGRAIINTNLNNIPATVDYDNNLLKDEDAQQKQKDKIVIQGYIYIMRDICNIIANNNPNIYDILNSTDVNTLKGPIYFTPAHLDILSKDIETLVLALISGTGSSMPSLGAS
jgi:hypothetical protein